MRVANFDSFKCDTSLTEGKKKSCLNATFFVRFL
jgi:hypothetical protein